MYYALSDSFTGDNPSEYTSGFANTTEVIAFTSRAARDAWVRDTRLLSAAACSYGEAMRRTPWASGEGVGLGARFGRVKAVRLHGTDYQYHVMASRRY